MTTDEARNEIFKMLKDAWAGSSTYSPADPQVPIEIRWQGVSYGNPPALNAPYAAATVIHGTGNQASLGPTGGRLYDRNGKIVVQCFAPLSSTKHLTIATGLATIARNVFEGAASPGGIWFRNCSTPDIGPNDGWFEVDMMADFIYSELR